MKDETIIHRGELPSRYVFNELFDPNDACVLHLVEDICKNVGKQVTESNVWAYIEERFEAYTAALSSDSKIDPETIWNDIDVVLSAVGFDVLWYDIPLVTTQRCWDFQSQPTKEDLQAMLKPFNIVVTNHPGCDGSDTYGFIFSNRKLTKEELKETIEVNP